MIRGLSTFGKRKQLLKRRHVRRILMPGMLQGMRVIKLYGKRNRERRWLIGHGVVERLLSLNIMKRMEHMC